MAQQTPNIANREPSYAIGMGWVTEEGKVKFSKVFGHHVEEGGDHKVNDLPVRGFQRILVEAGRYKGGNEEIILSKGEIQGFIDSFKSHEGTLAFLKALKKKKNITGFIVLMHHETPPATQLQAELLAEMFRKGEIT